MKARKSRVSGMLDNQISNSALTKGINTRKEYYYRMSMAALARIKATYKAWNDKRKLNRIIRRLEVHNERELINSGIRAGTVFEEQVGSRRWMYVGRCVTHFYSCGSYHGLDQSDMPTGATIHMRGIKSDTMRKVGYYSPREWIDHVYANKSIAELLVLIEDDFRVL